MSNLHNVLYTPNKISFLISCIGLAKKFIPVFPYQLMITQPSFPMHWSQLSQSFIHSCPGTRNMSNEASFEMHPPAPAIVALSCSYYSTSHLGHGVDPQAIMKQGDINPAVFLPNSWPKESVSIRLLLYATKLWGCFWHNLIIRTRINIKMDKIWPLPSKS